MGPAALADFGPHATARFSFYEYMPVNSVVTLTSDTTATSRFYALEVGVDRATGDWIEIYGLYDDELVVRDGEWLFASRAFQTLAQRVGAETRTFPPSDPPP